MLCDKVVLWVFRAETQPRNRRSNDLLCAVTDVTNPHAYFTEGRLEKSFEIKNMETLKKSFFFAIGRTVEFWSIRGAFIFQYF